jgi:hypothetical protein
VVAPFFCANPDCVLHVRTDDPTVAGHGPWARRPDGVWTGQTADDGVLYCDLCVRAKNLARARLVKRGDDALA